MTCSLLKIKGTRSLTIVERWVILNELSAASAFFSNSSEILQPRVCVLAFVIAGKRFATTAILKETTLLIHRLD